MNIQFYTWHPGASLNTHPAARTSGLTGSENVRPGSYDRVTFQTKEELVPGDTSFARTLAKRVTGQLTASHSPSPERIAELRRQIADGSYHPDEMAIAQAMFER